jgi:hypothetical protein
MILRSSLASRRGNAKAKAKAFLLAGEQINGRSRG